MEALDTCMCRWLVLKRFPVINLEQLSHNSVIASLGFSLVNNYAIVWVVILHLMKW